jgi:hypothetical protein
MKKIRPSYTTVSSGIGETILNILIVPALLVLFLVSFFMVKEFRESGHMEFSPRNQLYTLEDKNYGDFISNYYSTLGNISEGSTEDEKALRNTAEYVEAAFLHRAAKATGDTVLEKQQKERMDRAYGGMGMYAGEADSVEELLESW